MDMKSRCNTRRRGSALTGVTELLRVHTNWRNVSSRSQGQSASSNDNTQYTREQEGKFRSNSAVSSAEAGDVMQADEYQTAA